MWRSRTPAGMEPGQAGACQAFWRARAQAGFLSQCRQARGPHHFPGKILLSLAPLLLTGCDGIQSALNPGGPAAASIARLFWVMLGGAAAIFLLVLGILAYVLLSSPARRGSLNPNRFIFAGGIALPVVTLSLLLVFVMRTGGGLVTAPEEPPLIVEVIGHQWWWEFRYPGAGPDQEVVTANELHIPVGRPVELRLRTADVIHTFWVPGLAGKIDLIPRMENTLYLQADQARLFRGMCNEFCGAQHTLMRLYVISEPAGEFDDWLARQRQPAAEPADSVLQTGQNVFMSSGCSACHTIRGTPAAGTTGPDLTHFGSRRTLAAGTLQNTRGNVEGWIASSQHLKPENHMPSFPLPGTELHPLSRYLESLE